MPQGAEKPRYETVPEQMRAVEPPEHMPWLFDWLMDVGPVLSGGMGPAPVGYEQIDAWARIAGTSPTPTECGMLRRLSRAYCAQLDKRDRHEPAPMVTATPPDSQSRARVAEAFKALASRRKKGSMK